MEVEEYLEKAADICIESACSSCPLRPFHCGAPKKEDIDKCITLVANYEFEKHPFGRCNSCKEEFNSELISEYNITHCPWCGQAID